MNYRELLADAQAHPDDTDYHALRMAYLHSDEYAPYIEDTDTIRQLQHALPARDFDAALDAIDHLLELDYLDIEAHMSASYVYLQLEDHDRMHYHRTFAKGLIDAILATGSGTDFDHAVIVLRIAEEYVVLRVQSYAPTGQRLVQHEGRWYDILTAQHAETGTTREFYFDINLPRDWLENHMGGGSQPEGGDEA